MFESEFFEFFSHIHPWQPPAFYIPLIGTLCWMGLDRGRDPGRFIALFTAGVVIWTLAEYWLHRKVFHYHAKSKLGKRVFWLLHGVHHDWPNDKLRLVFPPTLSLPLAGLAYLGFGALAGPIDCFPLTAGLATGYLAYDMIHYFVHHFSPRNRVGKFLRKYHLAHHFKSPETGFGVSTPIWDYVFRTTPRAK